MTSFNNWASRLTGIRDKQTARAVVVLALTQVTIYLFILAMTFLILNKFEDALLDAADIRARWVTKQLPTLPPAPLPPPPP